MLLGLNANPSKVGDVHVSPIVYDMYLRPNNDERASVCVCVWSLTWTVLYEAGFVLLSVAATRLTAIGWRWLVT